MHSKMYCNRNMHCGLFHEKAVCAKEPLNANGAQGPKNKADKSSCQSLIGNLI